MSARVPHHSPNFETSDQVMDRLGTLLKSTVAWFHPKDISTDTSDVWLKSWYRIATTYGLQVFEMALEQLLDDAREIPLPVAIRERCIQLSRDAATETATDRLHTYERRVKEDPSSFVDLRNDPEWKGFLQQLMAKAF